MGRAYTDKEREQIRIRLMEAGLELFHDKGSRTISIRELTKRAGIAQGGFYNFFPDKDALVIELIRYRAKQKSALFEETFEQSLENPGTFLSSCVFNMMWDLKQKADKKPMYADMLRLGMTGKEENRQKLFEDFYSSLQRLVEYWRAHDLGITVDVKGISNVIKGFMILYAHLDQLDGDYSAMILKTFIEEGCRKYMTFDKQIEQEENDDDSNL